MLYGIFDEKDYQIYGGIIIDDNKSHIDINRNKKIDRLKEYIETNFPHIEII